MRPISGSSACPPGARVATARAYASPVPALVLGPMLRYVGEECAHVWVETDSPCEVEVLGAKSPDLPRRRPSLRAGPDRGARPQHRLRVRGPPRRRASCGPSRTPSTRPAGSGPTPRTKALQVVFGSCRVAAPNEAPHNLPKDEDPEGREVDALRGLAKRMLDEPFDDWPDLLLMLGDQVYADETSPGTKEFIRQRRHHGGAGRRGRPGLRGVHPPVPRVLVGAADPLAAVHRLDGDDLRRPRRPRRLEHLLHAGSTRCAPGRCGTSTSSGR